MLTSMLVLALFGVQEQAEDANKALAELCKTSRNLPNFSFTIEMEETGAYGGDRPIAPTKGRYAKGSPVELERGGIKAYRYGETLIQPLDGEVWEVFDIEAAFGGGGDPEQTRAMFSFSSMPLPHLILAELSGLVGEVEKSEQDGKLVYSGKLDEKGAERYSGAQRTREMVARFSGEEPELEVAGRFELVVSREGAFETITIETSMSGDLGTRSIDRRKVSKATLSKVGKTELKVPKGVLACIEI